MKKPLRIIHAADLHLDSPLEALGAKAALRRAEMREMPRRIAELCRKKGADLLLLAGDILDGEKAYGETAEQLCAALGELDIPIFIAPGNHDFYSPDCLYSKPLPENLHIFRGSWECVELPELGVAIWGAGYTDMVCPPLLRGFSAPEKEGTVNIGILHGDLGAAGEGRYCPITAEEVAQSGFAYLALGHQHAHSGLMRFGGTVCAYPGCPEGRGFDECGEKGILYIEIGDGEVCGEFIPTARRRYEIMELDISGGIPPRPTGHGEDIVRIILSGESDTAPDLHRLQMEWEGNFFALQLRDRSRLRRDLWEGSARDSLRGLFLRKMREKYDSATTEAERQKIVAATRWGLAALEGREAVSEV